MDPTIIVALLAVIAAVVAWSMMQSSTSSQADGSTASKQSKASANKPKKQKKAQQKQKKTEKKRSAPAPAPAPVPQPEPEPEFEPEPIKKGKGKGKGKKESKKGKGKKVVSAPAPAPAPAPSSGLSSGWETLNAATDAGDDGGWETVAVVQPKKKKKPRAAAVKSDDGSVEIDLGDAVAAVIGKGGATIKAIQEKTGAKLDIEKGKSGSGSKVKISGPNAGAVGSAVKAVKEILGKSAGPAAKKTIEAGGKVAAVIGRGGSTIKHIQETTGARVDIPRDEPEGCEVVLLSGTSEQVRAAEQLVRQALSGVDITAEAVESVDVGAKGVPLIIGKGGATIRALQQSTGARIDVERGGSTARVSGSKEEVAAATAAIRKLIADNSNVAKMPLACHVGAVIGKGGATIRSLQDETGAKVDVEADGSDSCLVALSGTVQQIAAAKAKLAAIVEQESAGPVLQAGEVKEVLELPSGCIGTIIGSGGANIKQMQQDTGAKIDISRGSSTCTIYGQPEPVAKAKAKVDAIVERQKKFDEERAAREAAVNAMTAAAAPVAEEGGDDSVWAAAEGW